VPDTLRPVQLSDDDSTLRLLDQRALPGEERWLELDTLEPIAEAIETLAVRGAPAIGCAAALGMASISQAFDESPARWREQFAAARERLAHTRPTAVNLFVALDELDAAVRSMDAAATGSELRVRVIEVARAHVAADLAACFAMGEHGAALLPDHGGVLTHCNTGALATAGHGTALGAIRTAWAAGKRFHVFADETRPLLQGGRLTAWELERESIDVSVITDSMAGAMMQAGLIDAVIVGSDRITRGGDVANKIGTYGVAVLAHHHQIPFYVVAPWTTVDLSLESGADIPIEERGADEVRRHGGRLMTPADVRVRNPAFDVTPAALVTRIVTETGAYPPERLADAARSLGRI
jgi:methylthioribose-1-phosphate isomerase